MVGGGILCKMRPHLGKMRPIWAICMKSGYRCSRIGGALEFGGGGESNPYNMLSLLCTEKSLAVKHFLMPI